VCAGQSRVYCPCLLTLHYHRFPSNASAPSPTRRLLSPSTLTRPTSVAQNARPMPVAATECDLTDRYRTFLWRELLDGARNEHDGAIGIEISCKVTPRRRGRGRIRDVLQRLSPTTSQFGELTGTRHRSYDLGNLAQAISKR
jgi:hypothetical protein